MLKQGLGLLAATGEEAAIVTRNADGTGLFGTFFFLVQSLWAGLGERERDRNGTFWIMQGQVGGSNQPLDSDLMFPKFSAPVPSA